MFALEDVCDSMSFMAISLDDSERLLAWYLEVGASHAVCFSLSRSIM